MEDLKIIKIYNDMKTLTDFCKEINYDRSNVITGRAPNDKISEVAKKCKIELLDTILKMLGD